MPMCPNQQLNWASTKDVGQVLRDYRKLSHGITVGTEDTAMFVRALISIAEQIIKSV
jgi:hypothetical protein